MMEQALEVFLTRVFEEPLRRFSEEIAEVFFVVPQKSVDVIVSLFGCGCFEQAETTFCFLLCLFFFEEGGICPPHT